MSTTPTDETPTPTPEQQDPAAPAPATLAQDNGQANTDSADSESPAPEAPSEDKDEEAPADAPTSEDVPEPTPQPEAPAQEPTSEPAATPDDGGSEASIQVDVEMMLYEAGMIANSLSSKALGSALADKLFASEQAAEGAGQSRFTFSFTPFEAGMAMGSMGRVVDGSLDRLKASLGQALGEVMQDHNIPPLGDQGGAVGGSL